MVQTLDLQNLFAQGIAYLGSLLVFAGAVQLAINALKPLFLDYLKEKLSAQQYEIMFYVFRAVVTIGGFIYVWGGVATVKATLPSLPATIPDLGLAVVSIALIILGEEIIHPLMDRLYALRDAAKLLEIIPVPVDPTGTTTVTTTPTPTDDKVTTTVTTTTTEPTTDSGEAVG